MAKCDEGYRCEVCGVAVDDVRDSDLYLRYVLGLVDAEQLHTLPERHLRCNPALAQFIVDDGFAAVDCAGEFSKRNLDPAFVAARESLVTRAWRRLREVAARALPITSYPLTVAIAADPSGAPQGCHSSKNCG